MVLSDSDLDTIWRQAGTYGGKIEESLEVALENERRSFSEITTRLFKEYRDLKANFERTNDALEKLKPGLQKTAEKSDLIGILQGYERELSQIISDTATYNLDRISIANRVAGIRDGMRRKLQELGYKGRF